MHPAQTTRSGSANQATQSDPNDAWIEVLGWFVASESLIAQLRGAMGVSANEMNALLALRAEGPCAISELAERVQLSRPALTTMVERLHRAGWIDRTPHSGDRRKVIIQLTERFDHEFIERSTLWRHRIRNLAAANDQWPTACSTLTDLARIARRSSADLALEPGSVTRPVR